MIDEYHQRQLEKYLKSDEYLAAVDKYGNSDDFKNAVKKIKANKRKRCFSRFRNAVIENLFNIISVLISIAALIVAILSYLK